MLKNKSTQQSTNNWIRDCKSRASQNRHDKCIEKCERQALNKILEELYATVRKKDGRDYEPDSLRVIFFLVCLIFIINITLSLNVIDLKDHVFSTNFLLIM